MLHKPDNLTCYLQSNRQKGTATGKTQASEAAAAKQARETDLALSTVLRRGAEGGHDSADSIWICLAAAISELLGESGLFVGGVIKGAPHLEGSGQDGTTAHALRILERGEV